MKKYDALYIFTGVVKDDALNANLDKALAEVSRVGGNVLSRESLGKRVFSRPMQKKESGVYVKVRMELDPAKIDELVNRYHLVEEVFRVQILAVDERREAKIAAERQARERAEAVAISKQLRELTLVVKAKGGGAGRLFGAVTTTEIADALKKNAGITIDKRKLILDENIKNVGTYTVKAKLGYEIVGQFSVKIEEL